MNLLQDSIQDVAIEIPSQSKAKGWWDKPRSTVNELPIITGQKSAPLLKSFSA